MATLLTMLMAIGAVFVLMVVWITIDRISNNYLGERNRCAHAFADGVPRECCGQHPEGECPYEELEECPNTPDPTPNTGG